MLTLATLYTHTPSITLNGSDITELVNSITVTESLFDPVLRGHFSTFTTAGVNPQQASGCIGQLCPVEFKFHSLNNLSPEKDIKSKDFFVYKIVPNAEKTGSTNKSTVFYFANKSLFENNTKLISKSFNDSISNIVNSLCKELNITCDLVATKGKIITSSCIK